MKKLSKLKGAKALNRQEQQSINGGGPFGQFCGAHHCSQGQQCCNGRYCVYPGECEMI